MAEKKIAAPFIPDAFISQQATRGEELRDKQSRPRFAGTEPFSSGQSTLLHALLGLQAGTKAGMQTAPLQSPIVSLLAGLGAGAQVPGDVDAMRMQKIENMAVDEVSPALVEAYPQLSGVPLSLINKITPLIQSHDRSTRARAAFANNADLRLELQKASPALRAFIEAERGLEPGTLDSLKSTEAGNFVNPEKPLTGEALKMKVNSQDAIGALKEAIPLYDTASELTRKKSALSDSIVGKAARIGDEDAQRLRRLVSMATDVLTRQRTGAALNAQEQKYYDGLVNDVLRSDGQNRQAMVDLLDFYEKIDAEIESGRRKNSKFAPSAGAKAKAAPAPAAAVTEKPIALSGKNAKRLQELRDKAAAAAGGKP